MRKYITKASERIGVESTSRDGKRAQVVSYSTCENFIIRFCDGKEMKLKNWRYFIEGNFNYEKHFKAPRNREERIGEKKVMNNGLTAEVSRFMSASLQLWCMIYPVHFAVKNMETQMVKIRNLKVNRW